MNTGLLGGGGLSGTKECYSLIEKVCKRHEDIHSQICAPENMVPQTCGSMSALYGVMSISFTKGRLQAQLCVDAGAPA